MDTTQLVSCSTTNLKPVLYLAKYKLIVLKSTPKGASAQREASGSIYQRIVGLRLLAFDSNLQFIHNQNCDYK